MPRLAHVLSVSLFLSLLVACGNTSRPFIANTDLGSGGGCASDFQCSGAMPRCDLNTKTCVACLPQLDNCPKGQRCVASNGQFVCSTACVMDSDCARSDAGNPTVCCAGACVDTTADASNCGKCGSACLAPANATAACRAGMCGVGTCSAGFLDCDRAANNGCEVDSRSDPKSCGACAMACTAGANQTSVCTAGACMTTCSPGFADCDNNRTSCEANTQTDIKNCGTCGTVCAVANGTPDCKAGVCVVASCNPGFGDCNQQAMDGCETNLNQSLDSCGSCMKPCAIANGVPVCKAGACAVASCSAGFADCDSLPVNGCEVSVVADAKNCGACGRQCSGANSVQACSASACVIMACSPGFSDCDGNPVNGCEVAVSSDTMNCGGCGKVCAVPANASAGCSNAQCGIGQCNFGFADCNKNLLDGCEADLLGPANCGQCGVVCAMPANASAGCKAGVCGIGACNNLFGDCDGNALNGCEKNLATDAVNCGKCGTVCAFANASALCLGGQCGINQCNANFGNCDNNAGNGCEASLLTDAANCGKCGVACAQGGSCQAGVCLQPQNKKVLIVHADQYSGDVKTTVVNTGAFPTVDLFDAGAGTPTLQQLKAYDVALVYSDSAFIDPTLLGNNLADYYDAGGSVVVATFANASVPLTGRFGTVGNGYMLVNPLGQEQPNDSLGTINEPNSPLMLGVKTLSATAAFRSTGLAINGGVVVAQWLSGKPMIVRGVVKGRNMVSLNLFPPSSLARADFVKGDIGLLLRNALLYR